MTHYVKLFSIVLISALGIIVYSNTFHCSFHFDDGPSIVDNLNVRNILDLQSIWNFWPTRFLAYFSIAFNYHFNGLDVFGYHIFNLAVHLMAAILVWWLTLLTLSTPAMKGAEALKVHPKKSQRIKSPENSITGHADLIALLAGLVFVSHPIQTQAVTYIVQRAASMATLFYLATLCFYAKSRLLRDKNLFSVPGKIYYACSLITMTGALFTKETAISIPLMVLLYEFSFFKTGQGFKWGQTIPFFITLFIIPLVIWMTGSGARLQALHSEPDVSCIHYLLTQFRVMVTYIRLVFIPLNQNLDYDFPVSQSLFEIPVLMGLLFLGAILFFAARLFSKYRLVAFSIFWFFLTLLPESSFFPIKDVIFEHRLYLPLAGYSMFLAAGGYYLLGKKNITAMVTVFMIAIACNSVLTYQRNEIWKDDFSLWQDTVGKSPHKARPYNDLGFCLENQGNSIQAMSDYTKAVELDPNYAEAYNNRSHLYYNQDLLALAMADANKAIENNPNYAGAYKNRSLIYIKVGNFSKAIEDCGKAIAINPNYVEAYFNRGNAYSDQGSFNQAISDYDKTIEMDPGYPDAYNNRGIVFAQQGNFVQAISDFTQAIAINPDYAGAYYNRAISYFKLKEYDNALADVLKAKELGYAINSGFLDAIKKQIFHKFAFREIIRYALK